MSLVNKYQTKIYATFIIFLRRILTINMRHSLQDNMTDQILSDLPAFWVDLILLICGQQKAVKERERENLNNVGKVDP